jgi:Asp-tRNA(Asn)/Glu-tRNA(Gln) amidotransferase A subunit family amidase
MNGCSISLPYSKDDKPIGIMLNGTTKNDEKLLGISAKVETVLSK